MIGIPVRPWGLTLVAVVLLAAACQEKPRPPIAIEGPVAARTFRPASAFATYLERTNWSRTLTVVLTSYRATCEEMLPVPKDEVAVVVTITSPATTPIQPATVLWEGHEAHGGSPTQPDEPYAFAKVLTSTRTEVLRPGGGLKLTEVGQTPGKGVAGVLAFAFPGDGEHPASALKGRFAARYCRFGTFTAY